MAPLFTTKEVPMSEKENSQYVRSQEYTSGKIQPALPASTLLCFGDGGPDTEQSIEITSHDFKEGDFVCPGFFEMVNPDCFVHRFLTQDWNYHMRRVAQPILPFLYLGPMACLRDREYLRREGFTLLLAIRNQRSAQARLVSGDKAASELDIEADSVDVSGNQELITAFPRAIRRINDHIASQGRGGFGSPIQRKVLVFCESGNERSAAVLITYMMVMFNLDAMTALKTLQNRRFCVSIEDDLSQLLMSFESILEAKRDVERVRRVSIADSDLAPPPVSAPKKRNFDSHVDEEIEGGSMDVDESEELDTRKPSAPFQDRT
ncbi:dual specificity protein phosphatase family protein [Aspergillus chevalieri]|uniref:Tyrosine specific protein phosphatases domain-containing protein n=1 Tax=Aspergillus chevalieri TaxID=182096 RepID=A0A7R7VKN9_ASPCH|nr:uncharacterized protein ACHE_30417A [Aspergillus chevalieri]BCR86430.1 hypothetical protein ACHE_30417A [Aspergillus chevalieri]